MPTLIPHPTRIESAGSKPKVIEEYVGRVNTATPGISVAHMRSPEGWEEPGQTPEFDEYTVVLRGTLRVQHKSGELDVAAAVVGRGQAAGGIVFECDASGGAVEDRIALAQVALDFAAGIRATKALDVE